MVGGHQYGHIYIGAIGLIVTYFFHGRDKAKNLVQNCINCGACKEVCAAGIDLPDLIKEIHARIQDEEGHSVSGRMLALTLKNRKLFHTPAALRAPGPKAGDRGHAAILRHLPMVFSGEHNFRALPAIAETALPGPLGELRAKVLSIPACGWRCFPAACRILSIPNRWRRRSSLIGRP